MVPAVSAIGVVVLLGRNPGAVASIVPMMRSDIVYVVGRPVGGGLVAVGVLVSGAQSESYFQ